jgi:hypothetical protein
MTIGPLFRPSTRMKTSSPDAPVIIYDGGKKQRWSKWIMSGMCMALIVLLGIVRDCGNGDGF